MEWGKSIVPFHYADYNQLYKPVKSYLAVWCINICICCDSQAIFNASLNKPGVECYECYAVISVMSVSQQVAQWDHDWEPDESLHWQWALWFPPVTPHLALYSIRGVNGQTPSEATWKISQQIYLFSPVALLLITLATLDAILKFKSRTRTSNEH